MAECVKFFYSYYTAYCVIRCVQLSR